MTAPRAKVLIVIDADYACFRGVQIGIADFAHGSTTWHIDLHQDRHDLIDWVRSTRPDGLLLGPAARLDADMVRRIVRLVPHSVGVCTQVNARLDGRQIPEVNADDEDVGRVAAEHFLSKGFQHFGYVAAPASAWWVQQRFEGYRKAVEAAGFTVAKWETHFSHLQPDDALRAGPLADWLRARPKPLALLACNDSRAWECTQLCEDIPLPIPHDIALLGVDNDDVFCRMSRPALSSVAIPWQQFGHRAAVLLNDLLAGKSVEPGLHKITAATVVERQSSDVIGVSDLDVRNAVRFIRRNAHRSITVKNVVDAVPLSRRDLELRFRRQLNRTPLQEIRSAHLDRAKLLLATTDTPIDDVAAASGFASVHRFDRVFKEFIGCTPTQYRRRVRIADRPAASQDASGT